VVAKIAGLYLFCLDSQAKSKAADMLSSTEFSVYILMEKKFRGQVFAAHAGNDPGAGCKQEVPLRVPLKMQIVEFSLDSKN